MSDQCGCYLEGKKSLMQATSCEKWIVCFMPVDLRVV